MPCEFYLTLQINQVDGLHVTSDIPSDSSLSQDYSQLTLEEIIWLQKNEQNEVGSESEYRYCPRGLEPQGAQPDGTTSCPFYDTFVCGRAYSEYAYCPTDRRRQATGLYQYGEIDDWNY